MERDSFIFYRSFYEAIQELDPEDRSKCYEAVIGYALTGAEPDIKGTSKAIFLAIRPQIDANNKRYADGCKGREYGKLGGRPKKTAEGLSEKTPEGLSDKTPNENENENEKEKEKSKKKTRSLVLAFSKPTLQEVADYCRERNNNVDARAFVDFYESKGWMIGKDKMKDWKAAVRTWERRQSGSKFNGIHNNAYDFDELEAKLVANKGGEYV